MDRTKDGAFFNERMILCLIGPIYILIESRGEEKKSIGSFISVNQRREQKRALYIVQVCVF